jgi:hypothetical protein
LSADQRTKWHSQQIKTSLSLSPGAKSYSRKIDKGRVVAEHLQKEHILIKHPTNYFHRKSDDLDSDEFSESEDGNTDSE